VCSTQSTYICCVLVENDKEKSLRTARMLEQVKGKVTLLHTTPPPPRFDPLTVQRVASRYNYDNLPTIALKVTPRPLFTPGKDPVPTVQEARWAPGPVWTGAENLAPARMRSPNRLARSQSLYRLRYPAHHGSKGYAPAALYPWKRPGTHCTGGWVGPRAGLDRCGKFRPHRDSIPGPCSP
jgi:hypothetical protein